MSTKGDRLRRRNESLKVRNTTPRRERMSCDSFFSVIYSECLGESREGGQPGLKQTSYHSTDSYSNMFNIDRSSLESGSYETRQQERRRRKVNRMKNENISRANQRELIRQQKQQQEQEMKFDDEGFLVTAAKFFSNTNKTPSYLNRSKKENQNSSLRQKDYDGKLDSNSSFDSFINERIVDSFINERLVNSRIKVDEPFSTYESLLPSGKQSSGKSKTIEDKRVSKNRDNEISSLQLLYDNDVVESPIVLGISPMRIPKKISPYATPPA